MDMFVATAYPIVDIESKLWVPNPELIVYAATRGLFFLLAYELASTHKQHHYLCPFLFMPKGDTPVRRILEQLADR